MTESQSRYVAVETVVSIAINAVISIVFAWLVFGTAARIAAAALIQDALPQSFMIALMGGLVPTVLTHRRHAKGAVDGIDLGIPPVLRKLPVRVVIVSVTAAAIGVLLHAAILPIVAPFGMSFGAMLVFKTLYGATLAAVVTPVMLRFALADPLVKRPAAAG